MIDRIWDETVSAVDTFARIAAWPFGAFGQWLYGLAWWQVLLVVWAINAAIAGTAYVFGFV